MDPIFFSIVYCAAIIGMHNVLVDVSFEFFPR